MAAAQRLPTLAGYLGFGAAIAGIFALPSMRLFLSRYLGLSGPGSVWRLLAILFALLNAKNLPFVWHFRIFKGLLYQLYIQPRQLPPKHLFAPLITASYNSLYDTDFNIHKSDSTYFADLDVARAHTMGVLLRTGLARLNKGDEQGLPEVVSSAPGKYGVALGGVSCFFQRQIEPLQQFEIYTRVLAWDRKWLYLVSHIVRKGAIRPAAYVLQPGKRGAKHPNKADEDLTKHIFTTSIARYVCKKGRLTINPEIMLERSRLLPPRPEGVGLPPRAEASSGATPETPATPARDALTGPESVAAEVTARLGAKDEGPTDEEDEDWTWEDMEAERLRGLKMAAHFDALSGLHEEIRGAEVLGRFGDLW